MWSTGSPLSSAESWYLLKCNIAWQIPAAGAQKSPQHPCWEAFCAFQADPEATRCCRKEAGVEVTVWKTTPTIPLPYGQTPTGSNDNRMQKEFSSLTERRCGSRMERRLTEERGGGEEGKRRPRYGTEGLRMRTDSKKVSGQIICPPSNHIKKDHSKQFVRPASSLPSWQACIGL